MWWNEEVQSTVIELTELQFHVRNRYPQIRQNIIKIPLLLCLFVSYIVYSQLNQLKKNGLINIKTKANTLNT